MAISVKRTDLHKTAAIEFRIGPLHFYQSESEATELLDQLFELMEKTKCCDADVFFNHATGDRVCSLCRNPIN